MKNHILHNTTWSTSPSAAALRAKHVPSEDEAGHFAVHLNPHSSSLGAAAPSPKLLEAMLASMQFN
jgi:hypothetical protein